MIIILFFTLTNLGMAVKPQNVNMGVFFTCNTRHVLVRKQIIRASTKHSQDFFVMYCIFMNMYTHEHVNVLMYMYTYICS